MNNKIPQLKKQIRCIIIFFMAALAFSGATAIPAETELTFILKVIPADTVVGSLLSTVLNAVQYTQAHFPFLLYGNDWLAFAHFVIAVTFIGVIKDPVKNIWVLQFGMIACAMVLPFALVAGGLRGLPIWWRCIDCSFGLIGFIPLWISYVKTQKLEKLMNEDRLNIIF
jgi:hypothetical protein